MKKKGEEEEGRGKGGNGGKGHFLTHFFHFFFLIAC